MVLLTTVTNNPITTTKLYLIIMSKRAEHVQVASVIKETLTNNKRNAI